MGLKEQFGKIKDNWLIIVLVLVILVVVSGVLNLGSYRSIGAMDAISNSGGYADYESSTSYRQSYSPGYQSTDFAPEVEERKITKTSYLTTQIKRGQFQSARDRLEAIITASDAYLLNEDSTRYGTDKFPYFRGSYQIKVDAEKYDSVVSQLKELGEVQSFSETQTDITGSYTNLEIELSAEKTRLVRYQTMLAEATDVGDKITLSDRIFDQERRVKYIEESLTTMDQRVDYSTIYFTLNEKPSGYSDIVLVEFSNLIRNLVDSFNALLTLLFVVVPWAVAIGLVVLIVRLIRNRGHKKA